MRITVAPQIRSRRGFIAAPDEQRDQLFAKSRRLAHGVRAGMQFLREFVPRRVRRQGIEG
ncbi:MAG TPA: hypothetical protein VGM88_04815 [Kofleriaceae bacterium]|jgi:hypothetical protein